MLKSEREYKRINNKIRRRLSKLTTESVLYACIDYLHKPDLLKTEKLQYIQPWWLLLLIKWTILESRGNEQKRKPLTHDEFRRLLNLQKDLEVAKPTSPLDNENGFLFLRQLAIQQFWIQERGSNWMARFARESLLFGALDKNSKLYLSFEQNVKVSINDYIALMVVTIERLLRLKINRQYILDSNLLSSLASNYGNEKTMKFFKGISADLDTLRGHIQVKDEWYKKFPLGSEFYEESPLIRYPLLRTGKGLVPYSLELFFRSNETFIYDVLRDLYSIKLVQAE